MLGWKKVLPKREEVLTYAPNDLLKDLPDRSETVEEKMPEISFHRSGSDWEAFVPRPDGSQIHILVEDVAGEPNPEFAPKIAEILQDLDLLETRARFSGEERSTRLTADHRLDLICETHPKAEFALGFTFGPETVIVDYKDGEVFSWCFLQEPAAAQSPTMP